MKLIIYNKKQNPHLSHLNYLLQAPSLLSLIIAGYAILNLADTPLDQIKAQTTNNENDLLDEIKIDVLPEQPQGQNELIPHVILTLSRDFNLSIQYLNPIEPGSVDSPIHYQGFFCLLRGNLIDILNKIFAEKHKISHLKNILTNKPNNNFSKLPKELLDNIFAYSFDKLPQIEPEQCLLWRRAIKSKLPISLEGMEQSETRRNCRANCCCIS